MEKAAIRYMWNGIKVDGKLYKAWYSFQTVSYQNDNDPHMVIHNASYSNRFPSEVHELFTVENATDSMTDYFCKDSIKIDRTHPEWERVAEAYIRQENHNTKMSRKRSGPGWAELADKMDAKTATFIAEYSTGVEPTPEAEVIELCPVPTVESVTVEWSESGRLVDGTVYASVEEADVAMAGAAIEGHRSGGYYKTQVKVSWSDGRSYTCRVDLSHPAYCPFTGILDKVRADSEYMVKHSDGASDYDELLRRVS